MQRVLPQVAFRQGAFSGGPDANAECLQEGKTACLITVTAVQESVVCALRLRLGQQYDIGSDLNYFTSSAFRTDPKAVLPEMKKTKLC